MKVGKEDIAALIAALELFLSQDEEEQIEEYKRRADCIVRALVGIEGIEAQTLVADPRGRPVIPRVYIDLKETCAMTGQETRERMLEGELPVAIGQTPTGVRVDVMMLEEWQVRAVARKLRKVLSAARGQKLDR